MSVKTKVMLAILLAVALTIIGITIMVSVQMNRAFVRGFDISSAAQLNRLDSFVSSYFENALAQTKMLADSPLVKENIHNFTSYTHLKEQHVPDVSTLPEGEQKVIAELERVIAAFSGYDLGYVGSTNGGFAQAPNNESMALPPAFDPRERPWFKDTQKAGKPVVTEAYLSDAGNGESIIVCTVAAPVYAPSFAGVAGFDIGISTLTNETGSVFIGETGFVLMVDAARQVVSVPKNTSGKQWIESKWLGQTSWRRSKHRRCGIC